MDLTESIAPRSDQLNADDLMAGPVTVTITQVKQGTAEQPVDVVVAEFPGRAYKPSKSMRRVMVSAWGKEASAYTGHRLTLFRNPEITFGREKVGGIEIAAMSHIDKPLTIALTATRGKRKGFTVQPLATETPSTPTPPTIDAETVADWVNLLTSAETLAALQTAWREAGKAKVASHPQIVAAKDAQKTALT